MSSRETIAVPYAGIDAPMPGIGASFAGINASMPGMAAFEAGMNAAIPGMATSMPGMNAVDVGMNGSFVGMGALLPVKTTRIPMKGAPIPGQDAPIPGQHELFFACDLPKPHAFPTKRHEVVRVASAFAFSMHWGSREGHPVLHATRTHRRHVMARKRMINKTERRDGDRLLAQGIQKKPLTQAILYDGTQYTGQMLVDLLNKRIQLGDATDTARGAWIGASKAETSYVKETQPVVNEVKHQLRKQYGQDATSLGLYGLAPDATTAPSAEVKAEAVKKRAATKATGGKKAEKKAAEAAAAAAAPAVPAPTGQQGPSGSKQQ